MEARSSRSQFSLARPAFVRGECPSLRPKMAARKPQRQAQMGRQVRAASGAVGRSFRAQFGASGVPFGPFGAWRCGAAA